MKLNRLSKKYTFALVATAFVVVVLVLITIYNAETPAQVAEEVTDCIERADAACILERMRPVEREAYGMTEPKLKALLEEYVLPSFKKMTKASTDYETSDDNVALYRTIFQPKNGFTSGYGVQAVRTADDIICPGILTILVLSAAVARHTQSASGPVSTHRSQLWLEATTRDRQTLESLGVKGIFLTKDQRLITWDEWYAKCQENVRRRQEAVQAQ